jgi:hypothetical protein
MAINRIPYPSSTPTAIADYEAQNALLVAALGEGNNVIPFIGTAMSIGFVFNVGGVVYRVDTATSITGTASPYVKITPSGATASASFVANLSGVSWNNVWNGYYDGSGNRYFGQLSTSEPLDFISSNGNEIDSQMVTTNINTINGSLPSTLTKVSTLKNENVSGAIFASMSIQIFSGTPSVSSTVRVQIRKNSSIIYDENISPGAAPSYIISASTQFISDKSDLIDLYINRNGSYSVSGGGGVFKVFSLSQSKYSLLPGSVVLPMA